MHQQHNSSAGGSIARQTPVHGVFAAGEGSPRHPRKKSDLNNTFNDSEMVLNRQTNPAPTHARLQARPVTSLASHARRHAIGVGRSTDISMSVADREPGSLPYASHENMSMQKVTQKIQTSPAVAASSSGCTGHFKVKTDVTLAAHHPPGGLWAKLNDRPHFFSSPSFAHSPRDSVSTPRPSPGGVVADNIGSNSNTPQSSSRVSCGIPRTDLHDHLHCCPDTRPSCTHRRNSPIHPKRRRRTAYAALTFIKPMLLEKLLRLRLRIIDLHPRPSPASEVQEARGRGPMRISSKGTVHCSAPDTTRDFARIGDFLKSSGGGVQGGGGAEKSRPQTQAGSYKVVAPWER